MCIQSCMGKTVLWFSVLSLDVIIFLSVAGRHLKSPIFQWVFETLIRQHQLQRTERSLLFKENEISWIICFYWLWFTAYLCCSAPRQQEWRLPIHLALATSHWIGEALWKKRGFYHCRAQLRMSGTGEWLGDKKPATPQHLEWDTNSE